MLKYNHLHKLIVYLNKLFFTGFEEICYIFGIGMFCLIISIIYFKEHFNKKVNYFSTKFNLAYLI